MDCADDSDGGSMVSSEEGHADRGEARRSWIVATIIAMSFDRLFDRHQKLGRRICTECTQIDIRNYGVEYVLRLHKSSRDKMYF